MCGHGEDAWVNGSYYIFQHCSRYGRGRVLEQAVEATRYDTSTCRAVSALDSVCIYHDDTGELDVFAVNKSKEEMEFTLDLARFGTVTPIEHLVVAAGELNARNSAQHKDAIRPVSREDMACVGGTVSCRFEKYSWNVLRLQEQRERS